MSSDQGLPPHLILLSVLVLVPVRGAAQTSTDSSTALAGVREFTLACGQDAGRLWGWSLCGPLIVVDGRNGLAVATELPPAGRFERRNGLWIGRVPEGMQVANTAMEWMGRLWSTVRLPLPDDPFLRIRLLVHEAFHRIQPDLGLSARDAINGHLDERDGRYLLRLELRALATALRSDSDAARQAALDAVLFRAARNHRYPGSDTLENALEVQEGLAEYTGTRLSLASPGLPPARAAEAVADFENRPTFVRALGYGTGPLLGLLLDRYAPEWRAGVTEKGFAAQLAPALGFTAPADLSRAVETAAARYGGGALAREEDERAEARARAVAEYRGQLVEGPVIILRQWRCSAASTPTTWFRSGRRGQSTRQAPSGPNGVSSRLWKVVLSWLPTIGRCASPWPLG